MRRVRITSEGGLTRHTKIVDVETGADLGAGITHISIDFIPNEPVRAVIQVGIVEVGTEADARFIAKHPTTGKLEDLAEIVFADGTCVSF